MNILIVTGHLSEKVVRDAVGTKADILIIDVEVAAFITPQKLLNTLKKQSINKKYDIIFVPGIAKGNFLKIAKELDTEIYLGPKHACDLKHVLSYIDKIKFSLSTPACELISNVRKEYAYESLQKIEDATTPLLTINNLKLGGGVRMKVMGEIVGATSLSDDLLEKKINEFIKKGADIIDLGTPLNESIENVENAIKIAKSISCVPLSIDTLESELIEKALELEIDLVLSLNGSNIDIIGKKIAKSDVAAVIIPDLDDESKINSLIKNIKQAKSYGIERIIVDPVLDPIGHGVAESIARYYEFHKNYPNSPIFFGVGNITELMDVDSHGVNATLAGIASDVGASILFTPEFSTKTKGSISELKTASEMMLLAKMRGSTPKDVGIDLLILKEKRRRDDAEIVHKKNVVKAVSLNKWRVDPKGYIKIGIVHDELNGGIIVANHEKVSIIGKKAQELYETILEMELVSRLDHAGYLGRELMKAEIALKFNRSYSQDDEF